MTTQLLIVAFLVAGCGLIYELVAAAIASYLLGDSVTQFSLVIGVYLASMGVGSYLAKFVTRDVIPVFVRVEVLVALLGGCSGAILFLIFEYAWSFQIALFLIVVLVGILVGIEIPLLMRILKDKLEFSDLVSKVLSFDYLGALMASVLFPLLLVPRLGLIRTAFLFGIINALVAVWTMLLFRNELRGRVALRLTAYLTLVVLGGGFIMSDALMASAEIGMYAQDVMYAKSSPYQRVVLTRQGDSVRLFLNGHLQFDSRDEYRYHEALVFPGLLNVPQPRRVLILGGGDGLALREVLRVPEVESVTLVDLDPAVTDLFRSTPRLQELNGDALASPKAKVINRDAFVWLREAQEQFDFIIVDLPDPTNFSIGKLYTTTFFSLVAARLSPEGLFVVQSTSPLLARKSFWCVEHTLRAAGLVTKPYHAYVPSFGEWGFVLAGRSPFAIEARSLPELRFLKPESYPALFSFPPDMSYVEVEPNSLSTQILVRLYEEEWSRYPS